MLQSCQSLLGAPACQWDCVPRGGRMPGPWARSLVTAPSAPRKEPGLALLGVGSPGQLCPAALLSNVDSARPFQCGLQWATHVPPQGLDGELEDDLAPVPLASLGACTLVTLISSRLITSGPRLTPPASATFRTLPSSVKAAGGGAVRVGSPPGWRDQGTTQAAPWWQLPQSRGELPPVPRKSTS